MATASTSRRCDRLFSTMVLNMAGILAVRPNGHGFPIHPGTDGSDDRSVAPDPSPRSGRGEVRELPSDFHGKGGLCRRGGQRTS
ncbi:MAG: hypothetical protein AW07_01977 [Candidatus Accumulibacter sp. SK-11]|nr:MAG: hypothetical protein AW07_01977 [Candidatus Accumulibacter sp. SK-11]